ncbi:LPXTG cell wall anchor domain-containing protein [Listeria cornellensis]|uniref:Gram-positive cocci surface proteins LPxTG domain-containing protein n=1 Tax=Listeria cornellensis FSL F6-0969 TaxID=1265820 RepID=W7BEA5_9LIST|nr:hypothetical protein PCORN_17484 [Listeria cornellensis FSL F6-0969]
MEAKPEVKKIPKTGDSDARASVLFGMGLVTLGLAILIRRKE